MTKIEVILKLKETSANYIHFCSDIDEAMYFKEGGNKWNPSENTRHLILAASPLILAYSLPKFILKVIFGKANRQSRTFDTLLTKYKDKLKEGGKASKPYVPVQGKRDVTKESELKNFYKTHEKLAIKMEKWRDEDLDMYILPHPLLGKITLREMAYFTIFHIQHHQQTISNLMTDTSQ